mmetsp:Transcript_20415/g.48648  ORF Transcript_20415/g.48648 Transcript_20415/m.48648 type:complete len:201 (+) Transcript_20415:1858-2460(+)
MAAADLRLRRRRAARACRHRVAGPRDGPGAAPSRRAEPGPGGGWLVRPGRAGHRPRSDPGPAARGCQRRGAHFPRQLRRAGPGVAAADALGGRFPACGPVLPGAGRAAGRRGACGAGPALPASARRDRRGEGSRGHAEPRASVEGPGRCDRGAGRHGGRPGRPDRGRALPRRHHPPRHAQGRPQRPLPLRLGAQVQAVSR